MERIWIAWKGGTQQVVGRRKAAVWHVGWRLTRSSWVMLAPMRERRRGPAVAAAHSRLYVMGKPTLVVSRSFFLTTQHQGGMMVVNITTAWSGMTRTQTAGAFAHRCRHRANLALLVSSTVSSVMVLQLGS